MIIVALPKPAIINYEPFYPEPRGFLCQRHLSCFVNIELGRFPRVVENRAKSRMWPSWQDLLDLKAVQNS